MNGVPIIVSNEQSIIMLPMNHCVNSLNLYTTGTSIGLSKGLNANLHQRGNNQFANAVTTITAARANLLVALAKPLYPMSCKPVD